MQGNRSLTGFSGFRHGNRNALRPFDPPGAGTLDLIGEIDLRGMDRPLAFAAEDQLPFTLSDATPGSCGDCPDNDE